METIIRNLTLEDIPEADRVMNLAFGSTGSRASELRRFITAAPEGWLVVMQGDELTAMGGAIDYGSFAWIGLMAVRPERQRQGLGHLLMERILVWLDGRGCPMSRLDASAAGTGLYRQFGFVDAGQTRVFLHTDFKPQAADLAGGIAPFEAADLAEVLAFDRDIFGADRRRLLSAYLEDFSGRAYVGRGADGKITGYLVAQAQKIGPWVSQDEDTASGLLGAALGLSYGDDCMRALPPGENAAAARVLTRAGFFEGRIHLHMRRGGHGLPGQRDKLYGEASYAVG
jgi:GNAT superfamily N-acetyltransferase